MRFVVLSALLGATLALAQHPTSYFAGFSLEGESGPGVGGPDLHGGLAIVPNGKGGLHARVTINGQTYVGEAFPGPSDGSKTRFDVRSLELEAPTEITKSAPIYKAGTSADGGAPVLVGGETKAPQNGAAQWIDPDTPRGTGRVAGDLPDSGPGQPVESPPGSKPPSRAQISIEDGEVRVRLSDSQGAVVGQLKGHDSPGEAAEYLASNHSPDEPVEVTSARVNAEQAYHDHVASILQAGSYEEVTAITEELAERHERGYRGSPSERSNAGLLGSAQQVHSDRTYGALSSKNPGRINDVASALTEQHLNNPQDQRVANLLSQTNMAQADLEKRALSSLRARPAQDAMERLESRLVQLRAQPDSAEKDTLVRDLEQRHQTLRQARDEAWNRATASGDPGLMLEAEREVFARWAEVETLYSASNQRMDLEGEREAMRGRLQQIEGAIHRMESDAIRSQDYDTVTQSLERLERRKAAMNALQEQHQQFAPWGRHDWSLEQEAQNAATALESYALRSPNKQLRDSMRARLEARAAALEAAGDVPGEVARIQRVLSEPRRP